ncbi:unnamed protein product [Acanthocheilonema viteae]|uniref:GCVT N-terminal domain-containing protein n=1 Tax=Acanthocheilonema viteae TaxID=6277 RepID=A0A498SIG3_ACAVI|nr:unnamed protein product [Acanthocheilonema viteae]
MWLSQHILQLIQHTCQRELTFYTSLTFYSGQFLLIRKSEWFKLVNTTHGINVVKFLQYLCSGNIDVPLGSVVYTGMQNEKGGFVSDCAISRLKENLNSTIFCRFFAAVLSVQQLRFHLWLKKWLKKLGHKVYIGSVTRHYAVLDVVGLSSRALMENSQENQCPDVAQNVYMHLMERGKEYGVTHAESVVEKLLIFLCFYLAAICNLLFFNSRIKVLCFETVAIEKFFVCWGQDISTNVTLLECGRTYRVDFNKDFIGKDALLGQKLNGIHKRFVQLFVDNYDLDHDPWPQGGDLIYRYGEPVGRTTQLVMDILLIVR